MLWAREHEAGAIVYSPMASGLLTGAFTAERAARLEPGDWRADDPDFAGPALSHNLALAAALRPVAERHGVTPAAVAIAIASVLPRCDRGHRGGSEARAGGRLGARGDPGTERRRPGRHRRGRPCHRSRDRARIAFFFLCGSSPSAGSERGATRGAAEVS
jgi:hypothetical protein